MISGSDENFLAEVENSSFKMELSAKITAVAVLIPDLALTIDPSTPMSINSASGSASILSKITFEERVLSSSIFSVTSSFVTVVKLCLCMPSISLSCLSSL